MVRGSSSVISVAERANADSALWGPKRTGACMGFNKLTGVRVLEGPRHTATNYSRPPTCILRLEIEVDGQP